MGTVEFMHRIDMRRVDADGGEPDNEGVGVLRAIFTHEA